jgi:Immunoglobulin I-set domain
MAMQEDSGNYTIVAENSAGKQSCSATLAVDSSFRRNQGKRYNIRLSVNQVSRTISNIYPMALKSIALYFNTNTTV